MRRSPSRRRFLQSTALASLAAVAGCLSGGTGSQAIGAGGDGTAADSPAATTADASESAATETAESTPAESLDEWLADANGYTGDRRRYGPRSQPTVAVGHPVDGEMAFDPPVIAVPPGTNVRWDWTGHGGQHNVVALDGTFDSGRTNAQAGTGYHYVFDDPGVYRFVSEPHREDGMKGAVVVREPPSTGNDAVDAWVVDSSNFDGSVADETGRETATVTVGAAGNGGRFAFDPPVLKVSAGTTVRWRWDGGPHGVAFRDVDVGSDGVFSESGVHLEHTFEDPGTYLYACEPHRTLGMKGAIVVE
jgi:halocyanin-like protein